MSSPPEANTLVGDIAGPSTTITNATSDPDSGVITLDISGTDIGNSGLSEIRVFVSVDGNTAMEVPMSALDAGTPDGSGTYSVTLDYQAMRDGASHTYQFFSQGVDGAGNLEAIPLSADIQVTETFTAPAAGLSAQGIDVQNGQTQRSYIDNVDVLFNDATGLQALIDNDRIRVERFGLDETTPDLGTGSVVSGFSAAASGNAITLDFANGIGGSGSGGNGFYRIALDLDGDGSFDDASFEFFRLYGDANGDGKVTSADRISPEDLNGDGRVDARDRSVWRRERGKELNSDLFGLLDD